MNMTTTRIYEDIDCIYRCVLLLLIDMSTNCASKLKLLNFSLADVYFLTCTGDFKLCSNIHNSATQNKGLLPYTDLIHGSKTACKNCIQVPNYTYVTKTAHKFFYEHINSDHFQMFCDIILCVWFIPLF